MRPGKRDHKNSILITGTELLELKRHTYMMVECFGFDNRFYRYKGKRPIGLYRWDMECLLAVIEAALADKDEYPSQDSPEYQALSSLHQRLINEYRTHYG
ncbi:MAG: hypothetical protein ISS57_09130 [Anaerolineales bacterium]|nr:hypothetical protein [Anaerolineales bacterium]